MIPTSLLEKRNQNRGFSLIEILVAMALIGTVSVMSLGMFSDRKALEEAVDGIERAIRFSSDEAALRNTIIRVHFYLDEAPQEYSVEYGPDDSFVIPASDNSITQTLSEAKEQKKKLDDVNKQFNKIQEFQEKNLALPDNIKLIGIGSSIRKKLITDYHASIYVYPSGERDGAIVIIGSSEEVVSIVVDPFSGEITSTYKRLDEDIDEEELSEEQLTIAKELFQEWMNK